VPRVTAIGEPLIELSRSKKGHYRQSFAGDTLNCAIYLKRAEPSIHIEYITVLGQDKFSEQMIEFFHEEGLDTSCIDYHDTRIPGLYIIDTQKGERSFTFWREKSAAKKLFLTASINKITDQMLESDLIYLSSIVLAIMTPKGRKRLYKILKKAKQQGVQIAFDSNYRPSLYKNREEARVQNEKMLNFCDIYLPSLDDEKQIHGDISAEEIIHHARQYGCHEVIVKNGKEAITYLHKGRIKSLPLTPRTHIVDSTSAGDSFNGTYLAHRLSGESIKHAIHKANQTAAKVIMHHGAIIPKDSDA
jgi:2-dehydro-3-deoxygluconokinase